MQERDNKMNTAEGECMLDWWEFAAGATPHKQFDICFLLGPTKEEEAAKREKPKMGANGTKRTRAWPPHSKLAFFGHKVDFADFMLEWSRRRGTTS